jgi:hypothetical protein
MDSPNHLSTPAPDLKELCIWIFHDARAGHLSQLQGLSMRLQSHQNCKIKWFDIHQQGLGLSQLFSMRASLTQLDKPDLILGAGHRTHLSVLIAGFKFKAFTSIIMKPSLPICLFNSVICPQHDMLKDSKKVFTTFGPINKIDKTKRSDSPKDRTKNLILLGGSSKHFQFESDRLIRQIIEICKENSNQQWILSNSPRTPPATNLALEQLELPNLTIYDYQNSRLGSLQDLLLETKFTWITPDSMSMIFEALTAGVKVGLFECKPKKPTRITKQVKQLIDEAYVIDFARHMQNMPEPVKETPWEADRAATWLLSLLNSTAAPNQKAR